MEINVNIDAEEIMRRVNLVHIRSAIFDRNPDFSNTEIDNLTYEQRLHESSILLAKRLKKLYKDDENALFDSMLEYETAMRAYSEVYAEIGMKVGARLLFQLLFQND